MIHPDGRCERETHLRYLMFYLAAGRSLAQPLAQASASSEGMIERLGFVARWVGQYFFGSITNRTTGYGDPLIQMSMV